MFNLAGLAEKKFHPHSLGHTYSHIIHEAGNFVDVIAKLIGHSNPAVTQKYYLTESSAQVAHRAKIP